MTDPEQTLTARQQSWLRHAKACAASGQSARAYAAAHDLALGAFYSARAELRRRGLLDSAQARHQGPRFHKAVVVPAPAREGCRLQLPFGLALELEGRPEPTWIAALIQALTAP